MTLNIPLESTYADLPERFYTRQEPSAVAEPRLMLLNETLAGELGLDAEALASDDGVALLAGNIVPEGARPLAQVYAGHQFGGFNPQLGDGRALLLGEIVDRAGQRRDIQLKGSGPTPYSRMGDGRAWVGPVIREYIVSEAMAALGIPTTRALAAVSTGQNVMRETVLPGAVLTRVASSHIRVGTFQFFAARQDTEALRALADHARARHYPEAEGALGLLNGVVRAQARLVADWMGVGFVHGVMNTDNTSVSGETIDFGPCAFLDTYVPNKVFSSIDQHGRYAYNKQPEILAWNLAQLATCLLPLIEEEGGSLEDAQAAMDAYPPAFQSEWARVFRRKLGLLGEEDADVDLAGRLLTLMAKGGSDMTLTFRALGEGGAADHVTDRDAFDAWETAWRERLARHGGAEGAQARLLAANPALIPRNHRIEEAIQAAVAGNLAPARRLAAALRHPFDPPQGTEDLRRPPQESEVVTTTFCGT
ncbi:YdiU family protein [Tropicimonas sp. IMCC34011]|uniref:protein adenylyltransferase SelO n=1 Tax=Tropicimonas sp. IMCC34011 TaxID=2248759 RepID=UPI000E22F739|nr:YdiU family protein [Tropicimonas sp. IMCC34011]